MKKIKEYLVPTLILFIICFAAAALLGITNEMTKETIAENDKKATLEAMNTVMPDCTFDETQTNEFGSYTPAYCADGELKGYAVVATGKGGYDGDITLMVGINADGSVAQITKNGETMSAISFLTFNETPSVGGKLKSNIDFLLQYIGLKGEAALSKNGGTVDAVSGATKTSAGITDAVNNALKCVESIKEVG